MLFEERPKKPDNIIQGDSPLTPKTEWGKIYEIPVAKPTIWASASRKYSVCEICGIIGLLGLFVDFSIGVYTRKNGPNIASAKVSV